MSILETRPKKLELLAPAGDWESLLAAISAGADAVYLGGQLFNARQNAANFDLKQLREAADLLHLHGRKIYVTVNTLIAESELPEALEYLAELYNLGADAIIIQDLGLIQLAKQNLPGLVLHASTQMTVHNREGASFLKELGFKRVVLARELTAAEVESIAGHSGMEVEIFVHGALCVCYSGQCLMSSMIGGRSGNRGRCAQPCRMEYQLVREENFIPAQGSYLLSPKDIALIAHIPELYRIGVTSLKIEGRMKRPEYVFQVAKIYRQALERYYERPDTYSISPGEMQELEQSFNRGFSGGYFGGNRNSEIMGFKRPNNRGVYLGRISQSDNQKKCITLKLEADLEIGDEVEVWVTQGGRAAAPVKNLTCEGRGMNQVKAGQVVTLVMEGRFFPGDRVFKIFSIKNDREIKAVLDQENPDYKIACTAEVSGELGFPLHVCYYDQDGGRGCADTEIPLQQARNRPLTEEVLRGQLSRLGNTPYYLSGLETKIANDVMIPISELNQARRRAIDDLTAAKLRIYRRERLNLANPDLFNNNPGGSKINGRRCLNIWVADYESVLVAASAGADLIYAGGDELTGFHWNENSFLNAIEQAHRAGALLVIGLPRINREGQRREWNAYLRMAAQLPADGIMVSDLGALQLLEDIDKPIYLNYTFNFFNSYALTLFKSPRIRQITLSPELSLLQIGEIRKHRPEIGLECLIQGPLELMISEYCPLGSILSPKGECGKACGKNQYFLRDRLNLDFPIFCDQFCRLHLLNAKDLCLYGELGKLTAVLGLNFRLELKTYSANRISLFVKEYQKALRILENGGKLGDSDPVIRQFTALTGHGITKGHFFRGVD